MQRGTSKPTTARRHSSTAAGQQGGRAVGGAHVVSLGSKGLGKAHVVKAAQLHAVLMAILLHLLDLQVWVRGGVQGEGVRCWGRGRGRCRVLGL